LKKEEKAVIVNDLKKKFEKSVYVLLADYKGLNVAKINELRRKLKETGTEFKVVKNTLLLRAAENTEVEKIRDHFTGPSAVILNWEDPVEPSKVITGFTKENTQLAIKTGVLRGNVIDASGVKAIAELPPREVLLAQVLSTMNAVPTGFVRALNDVIARFLNVLNALKEQKPEADA
jgi:large subunit ribosomal protein L10